MLPCEVVRLALISAGSVGTLPVRGGLFFLLAGSPGVAGYWQSAPRLAGATNGGRAAPPGGGWLGAAPGRRTSVVSADALVSGPFVVRMTVATTAPMTRSTPDGGTDDGEETTPALLGGAAFQLPLEFALGRRSPLFVGRHRVVLLVFVIGNECASNG